MKTLTKELQSNITPKKALELLQAGNKRFVDNLRINRNLLQQVNETAAGQFPFATILSCIDSRTSAELIFDQGLGDIFSVRIAGNIVNEDILGSMEFACSVAGSKIIVVLGHSNCGAIKGACDCVEMGNLTGLLHKIKPAIEKETTETLRNSSNINFVEKVASLNVDQSIDLILEKSPIIKQLVMNDKVIVVGGMYNVETGAVEFLDHIISKETL